MNQTSEDVKVEVLDKQAEKVILGDFVRFSYMEKSGAHVILDISGNEVSMRRRDAGLTQAIFDLSRETEMNVHSEHGVINFRLKVDTLRFSDEELLIEYRLFHKDEEVGHHVFKLNWEPEVL